MKVLSSMTLTAGAALVMAAPLSAQRTTAAAPAPAPAHGMQWGPQLTFDFNGNKIAVGARVENSLSRLLGSSRVDGIVDLNWFPGHVNVFALSGNVVYRFQTPTLQPYAGGGLSFWLVTGGGISGATQLHLDAVGGLKFKPMGQVTPVLELRYVFVQGDALLATFGILF